MAGAALVAVVWLLNPAFPVGASRLQTGIVVNPGESIQAAIDAANPGDTVIVQPGRYTESLTLNKPVSLTGVNSATTVIHAVANQRVLTVTGGAISNSVVISGLMFTGGIVTGNGGGILIIGNARPLIQGVMISNNFASSEGGGIYASVGSPLTLIRTSLISNSAFAAGGAFLNESVTLINSRVERNASETYSGGLRVLGDMLLVASDIITNSGIEGGGAYVLGKATLIGGRIAGNRADGGGALYVVDTFVATGTRIVSNVSTQGGGAPLYRLRSLYGNSDGDE